MPSDAVLNLRDFDTPIDINFDLYVRYYLWDSNWGLGLPNAGSFILLSKSLIFSFLNLFGIPLIYIEKIYLTGIFFTLGCGAYYFTTQYFQVRDDYRKISGLMAGLFYMFNIPVYTRLIGVPHILIGVALYPVMAVLLLKALRSRDARTLLRYSAWCALSSVFTLSSDPSMIFLYMPTVLFIPFMHIIIEREGLRLKDVILKFAVASVFIFLINIWWLTPILEGILGSRSLVAATIAHSHNIDVFQSANNLVNFFDNIRLHWTKEGFGILAPDGTPYFRPGYIKKYYNSPVSYAIFLVFLAGSVYISFRNRENKARVVTITLLGLVAMLFSLGVHFPVFGEIHEFLFYNLPGFQVMRNFFKFQYVVLIWYASLVFLASNYLFSRYWSNASARAAVFGLLSCFILLNALPLTAKNLAGRHEFFRIPHYYAKMRTWLDSRNSGLYRVLVLPQGTWEETYEWGPKFELVPMHRNFFRNSTLLIQEPDHVKRIIEPVEELRVDNLGGYIGLMGSRYVLIRRDIYEPNLSGKNRELIRRLPEHLEARGIAFEKSFGKLDLYRVPGRQELPRVYSSPGITAVTAGLGSMVHLSSTPYIEDRPALVLTGEGQRDTLPVVFGRFRDTASDRLVFVNNDYRDLVLDLVRTEAREDGSHIMSRRTPVIITTDKRGRGELKVEGPGLYEWYMASPAQEVRGFDIKVEVDGVGLEKGARNDTAGRWVKLGEITLDDGWYNFTVDLRQAIVSEDMELVVVAKERLEELTGLVLERPASHLFYSDRAEVEELLKDEELLEDVKLSGVNPYNIGTRRFYVGEDGEYSIRAYMKPGRDFFREDQVINSDNSAVASVSVDTLSGWAVNALNTAYTSSLSEEGLHIDAFFRGSSEVREGVYLTKKFSGIEVKERQYLAFTGEVKDPGAQAVEIEIEFTDKKRGFLSLGKRRVILAVEGKKFVTNLYGKVSEAFGQDVANNLVISEVTLRFKKATGTDLSAGDKKVYSFLFKSLDFLKSQPTIIEFDEVLGAYSTDAYYYFTTGGDTARVDFKDQVPEGVKDVYALKTEDFIDLEEKPVISLAFQTPAMADSGFSGIKYFPAEWKVTMGLDLDGDMLEDERFTTMLPLSGAKGLGLRMRVRAFDEASVRFPGAKTYRLLSMGISHPDDSEVYSQVVRTKKLVRYRSHEFGPQEFSEGQGVVKLDGKAYGLDSVDEEKDGQGSGFWVELARAFLTEGEHSVEVLENGFYRTEVLDISPVAVGAQRAEKEEGLATEFEMVDPTRYVVRVKDARRPFVLVFNESFHVGWRAYKRKEKDRDDPEPASAFLSAFMERGTREEITGHVMVNGYANAWVVPVTNEGAGDIEILLEYKPQRVFELALAASALTVGLCVVCLGYSGVRRKRGPRSWR